MPCMPAVLRFISSSARRVKIVLCLSRSGSQARASCNLEYFAGLHTGMEVVMAFSRVVSNHVVIQRAAHMAQNDLAMHANCSGIFIRVIHIFSTVSSPTLSLQLGRQRESLEPSFLNKGIHIIENLNIWTRKEDQGRGLALHAEASKFNTADPRAATKHQQQEKFETYCATYQYGQTSEEFKSPDFYIKSG